MKKQRINLEIKFDCEKKEIVTNIIFLDTGEIRQKTRSAEWFFKRIFESEIKTWKKNWNEEFLFEGITSFYVDEGKY